MKDKILEELISRNSKYLELMKAQRIEKKCNIIPSVSVDIQKVIPKTTVQIGRERKKRDYKYFKDACIIRFNLKKDDSTLVIAKAIRQETKWKLKNSKGHRKSIIMRFGRILTGVNCGSFAKTKTINQRIDFYRSREWRELRYKVLIMHGRRCMCCGATPEKNNIVIHIDHIKPRSKYPELELDINNMQILCEDCNLGKSNISEEDFRPPEEPPLDDDALTHMMSIKDN